MEQEMKTFGAVDCPEPVEGMFLVYVLLCKGGSFYIGLTEDLRNRLQEHAAGEVAL